MIRGFKHKGLKKFYMKNDRSGVRQDLVRRVEEILAALDDADRPDDMNIPGYDFHALRGFNPKRYTIHVNGPFCVTFSWNDGADQVDLENYH
jgi:proteic killer suppression protein